ncbi:MAG: hypothetical protein KDD27_25205 [Saprospiraceae bacterium]|nr:hypothetical protein [Saprospiraceae bacterium]
MAIYQILKRLKPFPAIHYGAAPRLKSWVERMSLSIGADFEMAETVSGTHYGAAPRLKPWVERMSLSIGAKSWFETGGISTYGFSRGAATVPFYKPF